MRLDEMGVVITDRWFEDAQAFDAYKKPVPVSYEIAGQDGTLETLEGPVRYRKGFYIMTGPQGERYPITPERFSALYDDGANNQAIPKRIIKRARLADHDGRVKTSWGDDLAYSAGEDYIVKHGANDYGVVKKDIFQQTYSRA